MTNPLKKMIDKEAENVFKRGDPTNPFYKYRLAVEAETEAHFHISWDDIISGCRRADIVKARHYAITALSFLTGLGDSELARLIGIDRCRIIFARNKLSGFFLIYEKDRREYCDFLKGIRSWLNESE